MKQTAVEWLENELDFLSNYIAEKDRLNLFKQAKEMEKKQIIAAYEDGNYDNGMGRCEPEKYYNETFNTNEK
jgi:hypothetical protein